MTTHVTPEMVPIKAEFHSGSVSLAKNDCDPLSSRAEGGTGGGGGGGGLVVDEEDIKIFFFFFLLGSLVKG